MKRSSVLFWPLVIVLLLGGLLGGIAVVGRHGTLAGRYERIDDRVFETDVLVILGPPDTMREADFPDRTLLDPVPPDWPKWSEALEWYFAQLTEYPLRAGDDPVITRSYTWREGPAEVWIVMMRGFESRYDMTGTIDRGTSFPNWSGGWVIAKKRLKVDDRPSVRYLWWHLRRWTEPWTAIHGESVVKGVLGLMLAATALFLVELVSTVASLVRRPSL